MARFKENASMFHIDDVKAPMMHGHTVIDFKDVKTGKRERVESDNTFMATNIAKYMRTFGRFDCSPFGVDYFNSVQKVRSLCGGIFLFRDSVPADSEYMQAGNQMTANGAYGVVNNTTPIELGSWNEIESSIDGNRSAVLVWDWNTSQGVGQIGSICLTSENGGYIGYGNPSGYTTASKRDIFSNQTSHRIELKTIHDNHIITFSYADNKITINKYRTAITQMSLFDGKLDTARVFDLSDYDYEATATVYSTLIYGNKLMIAEDKAIANNEDIVFFVYNPADDSLVKKTVVNTTGVTIYALNVRYLEEEGLISILANINNVWKLNFCNATTGAIVKSINSISSDQEYWTKLKTNLLAENKWSSFIDLVNDSNYPTNASGDARYAPCPYNSVYDCFYNNYSQSGVWQGADINWIMKPPIYLATINNLDSPVNKSNSQTMKVTYTLTQV